MAHLNQSNEVFHNHSFNIPHLSTWIDDIIKLTEKSLPARANPTTEDLVDAVCRYDACFREMLRQTKIFSGDLTRIYSKLWIGVLNLLDTMVKIYHRHVAQTASLQEQARDLIHQRQAQVAATKIKQEEDILERTSLRATIRNLEGELDAINRTNRELDRENRSLRALVETYIDARDFDSSLLNLVAEGRENADDIDDGTKKRRDIMDSTKYQMKALSNIDVEMNEILSSVQNEDDRQMALLAQFSDFLTANEEMLLHFKQQYDARDTPAFTTHNVGIQVDEKDSFGLVEDLGDTMNDDIPACPPGPPTGSLEVKGLFVPYQLRKHMTFFPHVMRIPSVEWIKQSIFAIYFSKIRHDLRHFGTEKIPVGKKTLPEYIHQFYTQQFGLGAIADMQIMNLLRATELHSMTSKRVFLFAEQLGIRDPESPPPLGLRDTDFILTMIKSLMDQGELQPVQPGAIARSSSKQGSSEYEVLAAGELSVVWPYIKRSAALFTAQNVFSKWLPDNGNEYLMKVRSMPNVKGSFHIDFDDFMEVSMEQWMVVKSIWQEHMSCLYRFNSNIFRVISEATFANDRGNPDKDTVLVQMIRDPTVVWHTRPVRLFVDCSHAAAAAAASKAAIYEKNQREARKLAEDAASSGYRKRAHSQRKSLTQQQQQQQSASEDAMADAAIAAALAAGAESLKKESENTGEQSGGGHKESVVDLMSKKHFTMALKYLRPDLKLDEVSAYYQAAQELGYERTKRELDKLWVTFKHPTQNRIFYYNRVTKHTQWACPYRLKTYQAHDVDEFCFVEIVMRYNLVETSPLLEYFHVTPNDLWPNTEVFYKELEHSKRRETVRRKQAVAKHKNKPKLNKQETV